MENLSKHAILENLSTLLKNHMASKQPEMILKERWDFTAYIDVPPSNLLSSTHQGP